MASIWAPFLSLVGCHLEPSWADMLAVAQFGESVGADTVFLADEILWRDLDWPEPRGWWDCLTLAGALAASTSAIKIGTWVLSALQHQPGMVVRAAETLDEISGGRLILGIGAGHASATAPAARGRGAFPS